jgi:O-antigen/teichoic acid export membrane protein
LLLSYLFDRSRYCQPLTETNAVEVQDSSINTWRMGLFGTANGVLIFLIGQSDLWWASTWFGVGAAGSYGTASYLARFCSLLSILLAGTYAAPFAAMLAQGAYHTLSHKIRFLALLSTSAGLLIWLALAAGLQLGFIGKWFHLDAEGSMLALLVLGAGHVIGSFFGFGPVLLASAGKFADLLVIAGASSLLTIILSTLAVLFTGLGGLGAAFGLSYAFFAYICHWQCRRVLGINPFGNIH